MAFFVRPSKYRHVYGSLAKRENCYDNVHVSSNAWDTNMVKANPLFISVNWQASGGGTFAVIPHKQVGKLPDNYPLYRGHTGPVLDTDFNPFNDYVIASGSEDSRIMIWNIPEEYAEEQEDISPVLKLSGHGRKVGHVLFHPVAENVLASSSTDLTIKLWDIEKGVEKQEMTGHTEIIQSMAWNYNGSLMATTCRDKKLRVFDVRSNQIVQEGPGHQGIKGSRVVWLGDCDRLATTGFSRMSDRQLNLWDSTNLAKPLKSEYIDTSSGVLMPFYDTDTKMLYVAGKGDGNIRYFEYADDKLHFLSEYKATDPQRGMGFLPKRGVNVSECEVARAYKVGATMIEPISFIVPRKSDAFQHDIFPPCSGDEPALSADEWFGGKDANPKLISLESGFVAKTKKEFKPTATPVEDVNPSKSTSTTGSAASSEKSSETQLKEVLKENEDLKSQITEKNTKIHVLEMELDKLRTQLAEMTLAQKQEKAKAEKLEEIPHSTNSLDEAE
ncbi:hypothetical protein BDF20DRAFT_348639 [Mycotypha africana]|uniref:uncharacterized protein n=1 Tax=Mycotypha africana TaxID=64632 RepID=UPI002300D21E|nr:uncharacterized protein BDF20DRAFT_348639 [Mycotypha africana]KAI8967039.1 hypothetical protein BDF20DRAFT_348639 [Mycotypha africana]